MIALILDAQSWLQIHCSWPCLFCCPYLAITSGYSINHFLVYNVMRLSASSSSVYTRKEVLGEQKSWWTTTVK